MPEYINDKPKAISPGEPIMIDNQCESPFEVSAGLVFRADGDYFVSVRDGKITVRGSGEPPGRRGRWIRVQWVKDEDWQEGGYWILRCSECVMPYHNSTPYCPHCGAKMDAEPPKEEEDNENRT